MPQLEQTISFAKEEISLEEKLSNLPALPGVYQFKDRDATVLYVGKAKNLRNRVRQYFQRSHALEPRIASMVEKAADVEIITTDSEVEALILEANLIKSRKPRYNVSLKDDKSYPYIVITNEPYPRVFVTRRIHRDGSRYFGPYTDVHTMRSALKTVRDIFMIRSCNYRIDQEFIDKKKIRVCLDYHIKKCEGPCEGLVSRERYAEMIDHVAQVLRGKTSEVIASLQTQMKKAAGELKFEEAAIYRNRMRELEVYSEKQKVVDIERHDRDIVAIAAEEDDACGVVFKIREGKVLGRQHYYVNKVEGKSEPEIVEALVERYYLDSNDIPSELVLSASIESIEATKEWLSRTAGHPVEIIIPQRGELATLVAMSRNNAQYLLGELKIQKMKREDFVPHAVESLQRDLRLPAPPKRIECFDISHLQGTETVASMVVFENGKPKKGDYRKFKIRVTAAGNTVDDFASMREVIGRRYTRLLQDQSPLPDLILVDGGKGQLSSASGVLNSLKLSSQPIASLAKRLEEVFVPGSSDPVSIPKTSSSLRLLQQIRDEAHRFAITYHRSLRAKRTLQTELDLIGGVGKKRAAELLEAFGSVQGVKFATEEQLAEIVGAKVAAKVKEYFEDPHKEDEESEPSSKEPVSGSAG